MPACTVKGVNLGPDCEEMKNILLTMRPNSLSLGTVVGAMSEWRIRYLLVCLRFLLFPALFLWVCFGAEQDAGTRGSRGFSVLSCHLMMFCMI